MLYCKLYVLHNVSLYINLTSFWFSPDLLLRPPPRLLSGAYFKHWATVSVVSRSVEVEVAELVLHLLQQQKTGVIFFRE